MTSPYTKVADAYRTIQHQPLKADLIQSASDKKCRALAQECEEKFAQADAFIGSIESRIAVAHQTARSYGYVPPAVPVPAVGVNFSDSTERASRALAFVESNLVVTLKALSDSAAYLRRRNSLKTGDAATIPVWITGTLFCAYFALTMNPVAALMVGALTIGATTLCAATAGSLWMARLEHQDYVGSTGRGAFTALLLSQASCLPFVLIEIFTRHGFALVVGAAVGVFCIGTTVTTLVVWFSRRPSIMAGTPHDQPQILAQ